jgi:hypothetical protein
LFEPAVLRDAQVVPDLGATLRDAMAERLRTRREIDPAQVKDVTRPRMRLPSPRPVRCE